MDDLYREIILDHYKNPRHFGHLTHPTHSFEKNNPFCGDKIRMEVEIQTTKGSKEQKIKDIAFSGEGCAISIASASMLAEKVCGSSINVLKAMTKDDIVNMLGNPSLTPTRIKCALLGLEILQKTI
jgi:nitrogen fixation protein NifU and related proteins